MTTMRKKAGMPNPTDKHVGSRVRLRRVMLNLNQTDLASRLNSYPHQTALRWPRPLLG